MTTKFCKNCGAWEGLHHYETNQCPKNGVEAHYTQKQQYQNTYFEDNKEECDLAALRAENAELREALIKAESALTYANWDGTFDDNHTTQDVIKARDNARVVLEKFVK